MNPNNDIQVLYAAWPAEPVLFVPKVGQSKQGRAILNQPGATMLNGEVIGTDYTLQYPASSFPAVRQGDSFIIDEKTYRARENAQPVEDGLEHIVPLLKVGS